MFISLFRQFLKTQTETVNDCDKSFICLKGTMKQMNFSFCQAEKTAFLGSTSMATNDGKMCYAGIEISTQQVINKKFPSECEVLNALRTPASSVIGFVSGHAPAIRQLYSKDQTLCFRILFFLSPRKCYCHQITSLNLSKRLINEY